MISAHMYIFVIEGDNHKRCLFGFQRSYVSNIERSNGCDNHALGLNQFIYIANITLKVCHSERLYDRMSGLVVATLPLLESRAGSSTLDLK